jgi:hypothetical protein
MHRSKYSLRCISRSEFWTGLPVTAPPHKLTAVDQLCAQLSYGLKMGRFELDPSNGELRFHASSPYPKGELQDEVIRQVLGVNLP